MILFDSHAHLQDHRLSPVLTEIMHRASDAGITRISSCGTSPLDWPDLSEIACRYKEIIPAFGLHPWHVKSDLPDGWFETLKTSLSASPSTMGEIGLDKAIDNSDFNLQVDIFARQLELGISLGLPVTIHCRRAWDIMPSMLKQLHNADSIFILHSYSGPLELIDELSSYGAFFSFSGSLTLSGNRKARASCAAVPAERLLLESDAPDMMPVINGRINHTVPNEPANILHVLEKAAEIRTLQPAALSKTVNDNFLRIFGRFTSGVAG